MDNSALGLFTTATVLTLLSSGGKLDVQHYDQAGRLVSPFNTQVVARVDRRVSAAAKLGGSLFAFALMGVAAQHSAVLLRREMEPAHTEAPPIEDQIREEGRIQRLQAEEAAKLEAYQSQLPLRLQAERFARQNNIPYELALELQQQAQAIKGEELKAHQSQQQAIALEKAKADAVKYQVQQAKEENKPVTNERRKFESSHQEPPPQKQVHPNSLNFFLGYGDQGQRVDYFPNQATNGFVIATGSSGSGKTETMKVFCEALTEQRYPFVFFAYHGDMQSIPGAKTLTVNNYEAQFGVNPFALDSLEPAKGGPAHQRRVAIAQISDLTGLGVQQRPTLVRCLEYLFGQAGIVDDDPSTWGKQPPNPVQLIDFLEKLMMEFDLAASSKEYQADLPIICTQSTVTTLHGRMEDIFKHPVFEAPRLNPAQLFDGSHVINLSQLGHSGIKFLVTDVILRAINQYAFSLDAISPTAGDRERFQLITLIDEAKVAIGPTPQAIKKFKDNPSSPLNVMFTELRKYGLGCVLFSQCLAHFSEEMLKQCGVRLIMKCTPQEASEISKSTGIPEQEINDLRGNGDAIFVMGQQRIRVQVEPTKGSGLSTRR